MEQLSVRLLSLMTGCRSTAAHAVESDHILGGNGDRVSEHRKGRGMNLLVVILVVLLLLALLGGGYGVRSGNNILAGSGGLVGLILVILIILFLLGRL